MDKGQEGLRDNFPMLNIRLVCPQDSTPQLVEVLQSRAGIMNVTVGPGMGRRPAGDMVQFVAHDSVANWALNQLRERGIDRRGAITIERVDGAVLDQQSPRLDTLDDEHEIAPIWELVEARIRADAFYPPSFYILLTIAGLIGAVGILTNSEILIVAAMVVGPEYSAIMGVAFGLHKRERSLVRQGMSALFFGFLAAILVTLLFSLCVRWAGDAPTKYLVGFRPVSNLINTPNLYSVLVALLAGVVGVVSLTEARAGALIGVFISVTTIPAAADIGLSLAFSSWKEAWGSAVQLLLNVVILIVVGAIGLQIQRRVWGSRVRPSGS
jgi:uncharacterized hydrophobic protein (TIGR00271 family)